MLVGSRRTYHDTIPNCPFFQRGSGGFLIFAMEKYDYFLGHSNWQNGPLKGHGNEILP
jgi:hypothetical protein